MGNVAVWNGFTPGWFSAGLHDPTYIPAIVTSLEIALVAALIATVLGLCAALALARMKRRWRAPFDVLVYLTLVVPEIVIAVASLIFFVQAHNYVPAFPGLGKGTILLGQIVFNASLAMLIIRARFVGMGDTLEEASYDLGRRPALHVPAGDAAPIDARDRGGRAAVVHVLVRRLHRARLSPTGPSTPGPSSCILPSGSGSRPSVNAVATAAARLQRPVHRHHGAVLRRSRVRLGHGQEETTGLGGALGLG